MPNISETSVSDINLPRALNVMIIFFLGASIQHAPLVDEPVPAEWPQRPDLVEQAERLDRLAADFDLVTTRDLTGFEDDDWDYFEQELAKYGIAVMGGWLRTGLIGSGFSKPTARASSG